MDITKEDIASCISSPKTGKVGTPMVEVRYNSKGEADKDLKYKFNDVDTCALRVDSSTGVVYKAKAKRGGNLFNPLLAVGAKDYSLEAKDRVTNDFKFKLKSLNKVAFDNYIAFLQTRHDSFLVKAERI